MIEMMNERNGEKVGTEVCEQGFEISQSLSTLQVVLLAHSMGCRCVQYFLHWVSHAHPSFLAEHIHAFLALGPPFLGAPKTIRSLIVGDAMGLEVSIQEKLAEKVSQSLCFTDVFDAQ